MLRHRSGDLGHRADGRNRLSCRPDGPLADLSPGRIRADLRGRFRPSRPCPYSPPIRGPPPGHRANPESASPASRRTATKRKDQRAGPGHRETATGRADLGRAGPPRGRPRLIRTETSDPPGTRITIGPRRDDRSRRAETRHERPPTALRPQNSGVSEQGLLAARSPADLPSLPTRSSGSVRGESWRILEGGAEVRAVFFE